jgi:hypothetical protein
VSACSAQPFRSGIKCDTWRKTSKQSKHISDWTVDGIVQTEHCIGFAGPVVNGDWSHLPNDEKLLRSSVVGVAGKRIEDAKSARKGSAREQEDRGDNFSMKERCRLQHINFWPVAIEVDGAITSIFFAIFQQRL